MHLLFSCALFFAVAFGAPQEPVNADVADEYESYVIEHETTPYVPPPPPPPMTEPSVPLAEPATEAPDTPAPMHELPTEEVKAEQVKPPVIELIEEALAEPVPPSAKKQEIIMQGGKKLAEGITAKIVGPIVIFNSKVASAAGALPPLMAASGAIIGSAIATPIEIGAVASSSIASGVTGKLVAIPITLAAGTAAKFVDAAQRGEEVVKFNLEHGGEILRDGLIRIGQVILKPIAIVVGAQTAIVGAGVGMAGAGIKGVGVGMGAVGAKMVATGLGAKALGTRLIKAQFPPYLK